MNEMRDRKKRVLLADDQSSVRSALRLLIDHNPEFEILGEAVDFVTLFDWVKSCCPDVVLLDWELPDFGGKASLTLLRQHCPHLTIIALSGRPEAQQMALNAGADAFFSKGDPPEWLLQTVCAVSAGR